jgi:cobalt-zinc-cadmium efflux system protein
MAADAAAVSLGVVIAGLAILLTGWTSIDLAVSLAIAVLITVSTWTLLRDSVNLALDTVPAGVDRDAVEAYLRALPGVTHVHDLYRSYRPLARPSAGPDDVLLREITGQLKERFGIGHATLQVEGDGAEACELAPDHVV